MRDPGRQPQHRGNLAEGQPAVALQGGDQPQIDVIHVKSSKKSHSTGQIRHAEAGQVTLSATLVILARPTPTKEKKMRDLNLLARMAHTARGAAALMRRTSRSAAFLPQS